MVVAESVRPPLAGHIYPVATDWPKVIAEINAKGCTRYRMALILGVTQSTVQRWEDGSEPRHAIGQAILELHGLVATQ